MKIFRRTPYFPAFGLNTEIYRVNLPIQSKCGKIQTRKSPNTDTIHAVYLANVGLFPTNTLGGISFFNVTVTMLNSILKVFHCKGDLYVYLSKYSTSHIFFNLFSKQFFYSFLVICHPQTCISLCPTYFSHNPVDTQYVVSTLMQPRTTSSDDASTLKRRHMSTGKYHQLNNKTELF